MTGFDEDRPKLCGSESAEVTKISRVDAMVLPGRRATDIGCGAKIDFGADFKWTAVVAEEVAGEATVMKYGADLTAGSGISTGYADEAGPHASKMCDYYIHIYCKRY